MNLSAKVSHINNFRSFCSVNLNTNPAKQLYKHILRECNKLPVGPKEHYKFMAKQSFKQYVNENDPNRVEEIIKRAYENVDWVMKKVSEITNKNRIDGKMQMPLVTSTACLNSYQFWRAILVYHNNVHVVNRKVAGTVPLYFFELKWNKENKLCDIFTHHGLAHETRKLQSISKDFITTEFIGGMIEPFDRNYSLEPNEISELICDSSGVFISLRILLPRAKNWDNCLELCVFDKTCNRVSFLGDAKNEKTNIVPPFEYHIELSQTGNVRFILNNIEDCETKSAEWLADVLSPKFFKWCEANIEANTDLKSLSLINVEAYYVLYHKIKEKYCKKMIELWPERTNPQKYVHEDAAIVSYLICLWRDTSKEKPTFVDLGCGNGLLVYMLNQEGYSGYGIDVRRRKIWDFYPEDTILKVQPFTPSSKSLFPEADFLIGNHSDELTPWIPVIAMRSSPKTNIFLLPCCPYEFDGKKYKRKNTAVSQYADYMDYIREICELCQFRTLKDKLRIPSTKRTCFIGYQGAERDSKEFEVLDAKVAEFIRSKTGEKENSVTDEWMQDFKPRPATEQVRNCTQLDKKFLSDIIKKIVLLLLQQPNFIVKENGEKWNKGGRIFLADLPKKLNAEELKELKNECGGLKTLLKNHRYLFEVSKDSFGLRRPYRIIETAKYMDKQCWFSINHPDGCLFESDFCAYKH